MVLPYDNMDYGEDQIGARNIPELADVELTNLGNGEILKYNSSNNKWENQPDNAGGGTLDNLTDTNITTPITNGSSLIYNTSSSKWENTVILDINTLAGLTDTNISSLADKDLLLYDNTSSKWINTPSNIDNLKNVNILSVANKEILKYNSTTSEWENNNLLINEINDVNITSLQNGEVLKYNSTSGKWENQNNTDTLNELTDVTLTGSSNNQVLKYNGSIWVNNFVNLTELADTDIPALINGDILRYNSVSQKWETGSFNIHDLDNVNIVSLANNEVLKYNSSSGNWENSNRIDTLDELGDVTLTSVTTGDLLRYNGTNFVNTKIALDNDFTNVNFTSLTNGDLIKYDGSNFINFAPTYLDGAGIGEDNFIKVVAGVTTGTSLYETSVLNTSTSLRIYIPADIFSVLSGVIETEIFDTTKTRMHLTTSGIATQLGITITSDGRVGIKVVEPDEVLQIDGKLRIDDDTTQTLTFYDTHGGSTKEHARIEVNDNGGGADIIFYTRPSAGTAPTEKLRINKTGAIGIGGENYGNSGQVLISNGSGSSVSWENQTDTTYSNGTGVTINASNQINIGQAVGTSDSPTFYNLTTTNITCNGNIRNIATGGLYRIDIDGYGRGGFDYNGVDHTDAGSNACYIDGLYGHIYYSGTLFPTSDDRLKINEKSIPNALNTINNINFYEYDKVNTKNGDDIKFKERGVIAQELLNIEDISYAVTGTEETQYSVAYQNIFITACQAIKELDAIVRKQQETINGLMARIEVLENNI